jgi:orotate phosphoribosyltransferase
VPYSAVQYVREQLGLQVCAIATLDDLVGYLQGQTTTGMAEHLAQVRAYRERYGVVG